MSVTHSKSFRIALYVIAVLTCLIILYPYLVMFFSSVKGMNEIYRIPGTLWPEKWNLDNYLTIWKHIPLTYYFRNSAIVALGSKMTWSSSSSSVPNLSAPLLSAEAITGRA